LPVLEQLGPAGLAYLLPGSLITPPSTVEWADEARLVQLVNTVPSADARPPAQR
jgi:hypothetical protein